MKSEKELLKYILEQINVLETYYDGKDEDAFLRDDILKDACLMKLMVIGEYSSRISANLKNKFTEVEWQFLKAARNYYAHHYGNITWVLVWETLVEKIPSLKLKIENIIEILEKENDAKIN